MGGVRPWRTWALRLTAGFGAAGIALLAGAAWRWRRRGLMLAERGTAYVIDEEAATWRHEEKESVLASIADEFAAVLRVPGPGELGENWHWQVGDGAARAWDERADQLVRSFWAVHFNDDHVTRNAVFAWAPWPVAMAFGARATARRRGLVLQVRERPSYGTAGPRQELRIADGAHDFLRGGRVAPLGEVAPEHAVEYLDGELPVTFGSLTTRGGGRRVPAPGVLLLVVRVIHGPVGPIELDLARTVKPVTLTVCTDLLGSAIPAGTHVIGLAEWRLVPKDPAGRNPMLDWQAFPAAAESIADWVVEQAARHRERLAEREGAGRKQVVLLATRIPQELAVGLGIQLGQRSMDREQRLRWPDQVFPVYFAGSLTVPYLRLGADSVSARA